MLLENPMQSLASLNLEHYEVLPCEPLHDLKGHIENILHELPELLDNELKRECKSLLAAGLHHKDTKTGADYRRAVIHVLALLRRRGAEENVCRLIETLVIITELSYKREKERNPKSILRFYNNTWIHFELLRELVPWPKQITKRKLYGVYLHAITVHAPPLFEIISLKSVNAEHEERLFGQAKAIATKTTNRKPETTVPNILLHLQAKQKTNDLYSSLKHSYSEISKEAEGIHSYTTNNTFISKAFISQRTNSWQAHLCRISKYLQQGEGEWWKAVEGGYEFLDGEDERTLPYQPRLRYFRDTSLEMIEMEKKSTWQEVTNNNALVLPAPFIKIFDQDGVYKGRRYYCENGREMELQSDTMPLRSDTVEHENESETDEHEDDSETDEHNIEVNPLTETSTQVQLELDNECYNPPTANSEPQELMECETLDVPLQTKLAKGIRKVLTTSSDAIVKFDKLRLKLKSKEKISSQEKQSYSEILCTLKARLEKKCEEVKQKITRYEQAHYIAHSSLPNDTTHTSLIKERNYIEQLLTTKDFC